MDKKIQITITGRVQGVGFRFMACQALAELKLIGSAQNLPDGSVRVYAEGPEADLERLAQWCHKGPSMAKVEKVEVVDLPAEQALPQVY